MVHGITVVGHHLIVVIVLILAIRRSVVMEIVTFLKNQIGLARLLGNANIAVALATNVRVSLQDIIIILL